MAFIKITKLNLGLNSPILKVFGGTIDTSSIPEEEIVAVNTDKIIGISQPMGTGLKDDERLCHKLYFSPDEFWAVKHDDQLLEMLDKL